MGIKSFITRNSYTIRLAVFFAAVTSVLMVTLALSSYRIFQNSFDDELRRFHTQQLERIAKSIDADIFSVTQRAAQTILSQTAAGDLNILCTKPVEQNIKYVEYVQTTLAANRYTLLNFTDSVSIYYPYNRVMISTLYGMNYLDRQGPPGWLRDADWIRLHAESGGGSRWLAPRMVPDSAVPRQEKLVYTYVSVMQGKTPNTGALLCVNIDAHAIRSVINKNAGEYANSLMIIGKDGRILSQANPEAPLMNVSQEPYFADISRTGGATRFYTVNHEEIVVSAVMSTYSDFYYVYTSDSGMYYQKSIVLQNTVNLLLYALLCVGLVLSVSVALINTNPIRRLLKTVRTSTDVPLDAGAGNEITTLKDAIHSLSDSVRNRDEILKSNRAMIENTLFSNLLGGNIRSREELTQRLSFINRVFLHPQYTVLYCRPNVTLADETSQRNMEVVLIRTAKEIERLQTTAVTMFPDPDSFAVIYNHSAGGEVEALLESVVRFITGELHLPENVIHIGVSRANTSLYEASELYREAKDLALYAELFPQRGVFNSGFQAGRGLNRESLIQAADELTELFFHGKTELINSRLEELDALLQKYATVEDYRRLRAGLIAAFGEERWKSPLGGAMREALTAAAELPAFLETLRSCAEQYLKQLVPSKELYTQKAKEYVEQHIHEGLSVDEVAAAVGISEKYFSRIFKESCGESFSTYVTQRRMERAIRLLKETSMTQREIAVRVGYADNYNYFNRKFKAVYGITPQQYRLYSEKS